jgi:hypothetical protein
MSKSFFIRHTDTRGLNRELYFTPIVIIHQIVENLLTNRPTLKNKFWIDPCAGDGRWEKVIKSYGLNCISYDINPLSPEVQKQDFLISSHYPTESPFFIGNPPYSLLKQFIKKAHSFNAPCYFLGGSAVITNTLSPYVDLLHRFEGFEGNQKDKRSKIKFLDTNNKEVLVWSCGALFTNDQHTKFKIQTERTENTFRVSVKNYCEEDSRVRVIKKQS